MHMLITGGTGFIGRALCRHFTIQGHRISVLTRSAHKAARTMAGMDGQVRFVEQLADMTDPVDVVINLAGATIAKRWSANYQQTLMQSRVATTKQLIAWMGQCAVPPRRFISASAIGYYGTHGDADITEDTAPNISFTHTLCAAWENAARAASLHGIPTTILRLGVVLGEGSGIFKQVLPPFKLGAGGHIGDGRQYVSWVHIADVVRAMAFVIEGADKTAKKPTNGKATTAAETIDATIYNLTAPNPVTNTEWTRALAKTLGRPAFCHIPASIVRLLFGQMGEELLLGSARVVPERLLAQGFTFQYPELSGALHHLIR